MEGGEYITIAGGSITEIVEEDYNIYAGGHIINTASKCIFETGENKGVVFGKPQMPPPKVLDAKCIVHFRPTKNWAGEFGFDWYRLGDTNIAGDVSYDTILGQYYTKDPNADVTLRNEDVNKWYVPRKDAKGADIAGLYDEFFKPDPQPAAFAGNSKIDSLKNLYGFYNYSLKNDAAGKPMQKVYFISRIALYPKSANLGNFEANLRLNLEFEGGNKPDKIVFEMDNKLMDGSHPLVSIDKHTIPKEDIGKHKNIIITCKQDFEEDKEIKVWAVITPAGKPEVRKEAGILKMIAPCKRKTLDVVIVRVKTSAGIGNRKSLDEFKRNLNQGLITLNITEQIQGLNSRLQPIKIDITNPENNFNLVDFDRKFKVSNNDISIRTGLAEFLDQQLEKEHPQLYTNHFKLYFFNNSCNRKELPGDDGNAEGGGTSEVAGFSNLNTSNGVMFSGHTISTIGHECMHGLGLHHSFFSLAPYTYRALKTDNAMDYSHWPIDPISKAIRPALKTISTWYWQWKIINSNIT